MNNDKKDWLHNLLQIAYIPSEDVPDIELYMDQITTFMDTKLSESKRYPDDKIMTKTMVNNYTKNHLLPPSVKKKYSKEHVFLLIMIYYLKNMLSISDIQSLLEPLSDHFFPKDSKSGLTLEDIYIKTMEDTMERHPDIEEDIFKTWEASRNHFKEKYALDADTSEYLDDFSFIYQLCYDIYVRKQMIEKIIDHRRDKTVSGKEKPTKKK